MIHRPVVLLDIDGVVCDFATSFAVEMSRILGRTIHVDKIDRYDMTVWAGMTREETLAAFDAAHQEGWCRALLPYPGAIEMVERLKEIGDVVVVTAPMRGPHWHHERVAWISDHLGMTEKDVIFSSRKELVEGDILIEDRPENVIKWLLTRNFRAHDDHHSAVLIHRSYNAIGWESPALVRHKIVHAFDWDSIVSAVEKISGVTVKNNLTASDRAGKRDLP